MSSLLSQTKTFGLKGCQMYNLCSYSLSSLSMVRLCPSMSSLSYQSFLPLQSCPGKIVQLSGRDSILFHTDSYSRPESPVIYLDYRLTLSLVSPCWKSVLPHPLNSSASPVNISPSELRRYDEQPVIICVLHLYSETSLFNTISVSRRVSTLHFESSHTQFLSIFQQSISFSSRFVTETREHGGEDLNDKHHLVIRESRSVISCQYVRVDIECIILLVYSYLD